VKSALVTAAVCVVSFVQAQTSQDVKNKEMPAFVRQLADTRKAIAGSYVHWVEAVKMKDVDAIVDRYANDATILPDENEAVSGKAAVRAFYTDWLANGDTLVEEKFENINSVQEGDLLIDSTK
jgi:ketosteroid isomerase-like protein